MALPEAYITRNLLTTPTRRKHSADKSAQSVHNQSAYISLLTGTASSDSDNEPSNDDISPIMIAFDSSDKFYGGKSELDNGTDSKASSDNILLDEIVHWAQIIRTYEISSDDLFMVETETNQRRVIRAATLPALLRSLTTMETTCQYDIYCFLLKLRTYVRPHDLLEFLYRRFIETWRCTPEQLGGNPNVSSSASASVSITTRTVEGENVGDESAPMTMESVDWSSAVGTDDEESNCSDISEWEGDAVLNGEAARQSIADSRAMMERFSRASIAASNTELGVGINSPPAVERDLDTSFLFRGTHVRGAQHLLFQDLKRAFEQSNAAAAANVSTTASESMPSEKFEVELPYAMLSVRTAVLLFLETWVSQFPEDFLLPNSLISDAISAPVPAAVSVPAVNVPSSCQSAFRSYADVAKSPAKLDVVEPKAPSASTDRITGFSVPLTSHSSRSRASSVGQETARDAQAKVGANQTVLDPEEVSAVRVDADVTVRVLGAVAECGSLPVKLSVPADHLQLQASAAEPVSLSMTDVEVATETDISDVGVSEGSRVSPDQPEADLMDGLINFVRVFSYCSESLCWGISVSEHLVSKPRRVSIPASSSLFQTHLPCLAHLRSVIEASDYAWSLIGLHSPGINQKHGSDDGVHVKHLPFPFNKLQHRTIGYSDQKQKQNHNSSIAENMEPTAPVLKRLFSSGDLQLMQQQFVALDHVDAGVNSQACCDSSCGPDTSLLPSVAVVDEADLPTVEEASQNPSARGSHANSGDDERDFFSHQERKRSTGTSTVSASAATIAVTAGTDGPTKQLLERENWDGNDDETPRGHRANALVRQAMVSREALKLVNYGKRKGALPAPMKLHRSASDVGGLAPSITGMRFRERIGAAVDDFRRRRANSAREPVDNAAIGDMAVGLGMPGDDEAMAVSPYDGKPRSDSNAPTRAPTHTRTRSRAASAGASVLKTEEQRWQEELQLELHREQRLRAGYLLLNKDMKEENDSLRLSVTKLLEDQVIQPLTDVCEAYSDAAAVLMASELQSMQNYDRLNDFVPPPRIFSGDVDKHVLSSRSSVKKTRSRSVSTGKKVAHALFAPLDISGCIRERRAGAPSPAMMQNIYGLSTVQEEDGDSDTGDEIEYDHLNGRSGSSKSVGGTPTKPVSTFSIETPKESTFFSSMFTKLFSPKVKGGPERDKYKEREKERAVDANMYTGFNDDMQCATPQDLLLDIKPSCIAVELTVRLHYLYATIPLYEFLCEFRSIKRVAVTVASASNSIDQSSDGEGTLQGSFASTYSASKSTSSNNGKVTMGTRSTTINSSLYNDKNDQRMLTRFRLESERLQNFFIHEVLKHADPEVRADAIMQLISVAEYLLELQSHHALMVIVGVLQCQAVFRLTQTWHIVNNLMPGRLDAVNAATGFGGAKLVAQDIDRLSKKALSDDLRDEMSVTHPPPPLPPLQHVGLVLRSSSLHVSVAVPMGAEQGIAMNNQTTNADNIAESAAATCHHLGIESATTQAAASGDERIAFRSVTPVYTPQRPRSTVTTAAAITNIVPNNGSSSSMPVTKENGPLPAGIAFASNKSNHLLPVPGTVSIPVMDAAVDMDAAYAAETVVYNAHVEEEEEELGNVSGLTRLRSFTDGTSETSEMGTASPAPSTLSARSSISGSGNANVSSLLSDHTVRSLLCTEDSRQLSHVRPSETEAEPQVVGDAVDDDDADADIDTGEDAREDPEPVDAVAVNGDPNAEVRELLCSLVNQATAGLTETDVDAEIESEAEAKKDWGRTAGNDIETDVGITGLPVVHGGGNVDKIFEVSVQAAVPEVFKRVQHKYRKITVPLSGCVATTAIGADHSARLGQGATAGGVASSTAAVDMTPKRLHSLSVAQANAHVHPGLGIPASPASRNITPREGQISADNGGGIPVPLERPVMPFVNGLIKKLVTLNEFPDYIKGSPAKSHHPAFQELGLSAGATNHDVNVSGLLVVQSPPSVSLDDSEAPTLLPVINTGKVRAVANLLLIVRATQITPFKDLIIHTELQGLLQGLITYGSEESQWERSCELEPNLPNSDYL